MHEFDPLGRRTYDEPRALVFDKLRKLFGGKAGPGPAQTGRISPGTSPVRRPARPRPVRSDRAKTASAGRPADTNPLRAGQGHGDDPTRSPGSLNIPGAMGEQRSGRIQAAEIACPSCGEPMLQGWGTTCGKCRPNLVSPKTMFLAPGQVALPVQAGGGMALGWLVVIRTIDEPQRGALIELDRPRVILSRSDAAPAGAERVVAFDDSYMSSAHALLGRPATDNRDDAFTLRDRQNPASANGTFVNSRRLGVGEVVRLGDGDIIKVGATELLFKALWLSPVAVRS